MKWTTSGHMILPSMPLTSNSKTIIIPNLSMRINGIANDVGKTPASTRPPSNGRIGNRFSTIKTTLIIMPYSPISAKKLSVDEALITVLEMTINIAQKQAMMKLDTGPATATSAMSSNGDLK